MRRYYQLTVISLIGLVAACGTSSSSGPTGPQLTAQIGVQILGGDNQTDTVHQELPLPIRVLVVDTTPKLTGGVAVPLPGQLVNFVVISGGGHVFAGSALTDSTGQVQELWTLGDTAGVQQLQARAVDPQTGDPIVYATVTAHAVPGPMTAFGFSAPSIRVLADTTVTLPAFARDAYGNALPIPAPSPVDSLTADSSAGVWRTKADFLGYQRFALNGDTLIVWVHPPAGNYELVWHHADTTWRETGLYTRGAVHRNATTACPVDGVPTDSIQNYDASGVMVIRTVGDTEPDTLAILGAVTAGLCHGAYNLTEAQSTVNNRVYVRPTEAPISAGAGIDADLLNHDSTGWRFLLGTNGAGGIYDTLILHR